MEVTMNRTASWLTVAVGLFALAVNGAELPRTHLLVFAIASGELGPVKSTNDWMLRRASVLRAMQEVMGPLPGAEKRCPLEIRVEEEVDCGSYVRRLLTYASEPGSRVPAYLLVPKSV